MRRPLSFGFYGVASLAIAFSALAASTGTASADDGAPDKPLTHAEGLRRDATEIAPTLGVDSTEAMRVLLRQERIAELIPKLESVAGEANAGISVDDLLSRVVTVRLTGPPNPLIAAQMARLTAQIPAVRVDLLYGHERSLAELVLAAEEIAEVVTGAEAVMGVGVDVRSNHLSADVSEAGAFSRAMESARRSRSAVLSSVVLEVPVTENVVDGEVGSAGYGGMTTTTCTSGFTIKNAAGATGFVTAGHCQAGQSYLLTPASGEWHSSTFRSQSWNANADLQWHQFSSHVGTGKFWGQSPTTAVRRTGVGVAYVGQALCHRGRTSGYSCGNVQTATYAPAYDGACNGVPCNAAFVRLTGPKLANLKGDSGGPYFIGGNAYGILMGGTIRSEGAAAIFTPIGRISAFSGLSLQ